MVLRVAIKIRPQGLRQKPDKLSGEMARIADRTINSAARIVRDVIISKMPERTGQLKRSVKIFRIKKEGGGLDRRANVTVGPTAKYAASVDRGAKKSPGMFVPRLGLRVKHGFHPGQDAQNYLAAAMNRLENTEMNELFNRTWVFPISRAIRKIGGRNVGAGK